jgi:hypothetical protein
MATTQQLAVSDSDDHGEWSLGRGGQEPADCPESMTIPTTTGPSVFSEPITYIHA